MTEKDKEFLKLAKYNHNYILKKEKIDQSTDVFSKKVQQYEKNRRRFENRCKNIGVCTFHFCECGNELNTSGSLVEILHRINYDGEHEISIFLCPNCKREVILDYGLFPYTREECINMNIDIPPLKIIEMKARYIQAKRRRRIKRLTNELSLYIINLMNYRHI